MTEKTKAYAIISGRVQGVFFRMETQKAAEKHNVGGWVRNRRDGTVEALFEGDKDSVKSVIEWCRQGPPASKVDDVKVDWQNYKGEFNSFNIRY